MGRDKRTHASAGYKIELGRRRFPEAARSRQIIMDRERPDTSLEPSLRTVMRHATAARLIIVKHWVKG